jgi:isochorismate synthase
MARGTTALAAARAAGFVHSEAAVAVSSDPLRLLRAFPASRRFLWLQPSTAQAIAGVGASVLLRARGARRFSELSGALADVMDGDRLPAGVVAVGGFAFDANTQERGPWRGFAPLEWTIPQITLVRRAGRARLVATGPPGTSAGSLASALARARAALEGPDSSPIPAASYHALGSHASTWRRAVEATLDDIAAGRLEKLVLARTCTVRGVVPFDPWRVVARLARVYPGCTTFAVASGGTTFVGATPELLARVRGTRLETAALAGTVPRGGNPRSDRDLARVLRTSPKERAEHGVVVRDICARLDPLCDDLVAASQPGVVATETLQHLRTPVHGRLRSGAGLLDAVAALHPTAAICGAPREAARAVLASRERAARGWYGGGVGWLDGCGGEVAVAIRTALLRGTHALLHAGAGIVAGSTWEAELEETRLKMRPLLGALLEL